ncbi:MAG TPA: pyridoxamine 5'-phosphate oxidase family protein [Acidimicrobiales bacterium]
MATAPFDIDAFLSGPLTARVATNGPTVRPTWFLWEDGAFWILTGPWARLPGRVEADPEVAIVVDVCDLDSGLVRQVIARGRAEVLPFDVPRGRRKLVRYLGPDETRWDPRFRHYLLDDPTEKGTVWLRVTPDSLTAKDLSYVPASSAVLLEREDEAAGLVAAVDPAVGLDDLLER